MAGAPCPVVGIVEDDDDLREMVREFLEINGFVVQTAATLAEAHDLVGLPNCPNLLVLDLMLPDGHGSEIIRRINERTKDTGQAIPVIALSGIGDNFELRGIDEPDLFLKKPCPLPTLVEKIHSLLSK